jgi:segregation and condensation protein A
MQHSDNYTIKIPQFEGPFDLLLFFIERDELDIHDIPISDITRDFLNYIRQLDQLNIDIASEFILVAATLMRIKAKMLLPRRELDEEGNEIDPRMEIAQKLLEYKKFKATLDDFKILEEHRSQIVSRGNIKKELKIIAQKSMIDGEMETLSLYGLLKKFHQILEKQEKRNRRPQHTIIDYPYTIKDQEKYIRNSLSTKQYVDFEQLFIPLENVFHAIVTFLALLELLNAEIISILNGPIPNQFRISLKEGANGEI